MAKLIDHIIYAHPHLDVAVSGLEERFGVVASDGGQHPGQGTHNKILALGPRTYLEVIAPDPSQPEPASPRPYGVENVSGGKLVGWALACGDIETAVVNARSRGFDPGDVIDGQRLNSHGALLRWRLTANALSAGMVPFLISWGDTPHPASGAPPGLVLTDLYVEHPKPQALAAAFAALDTDVEIRDAPTPALVARIVGPRGELELR